MADSERSRPAWAARLREQRRDRCWSQRELARRLVQSADEDIRRTLPTRESIVRLIKSYEAGRHRPRDPYRVLYCRVFGVAEAELFATEDAPSTSLTPSRPPLPIVSARSVAPTVIELLFAACTDSTLDGFAQERLPESKFVVDALDGGAMDRRTAMQLLTLLGAGALVPPNAVDEILSEVDRAIGDREGYDLGDWERIAWEYSFRTNTGPLGALVGDLTADIAEIGRLLDRTTSPSGRTGLLRVTVSLAQTLSGEFTHVHATSQARRAQRTARRAADASGDRDLRVAVRAADAWNSFALGQPSQVILRLLDDAVQISDGVPSVALARTYAARATVLAARSAEEGDAGEAARTALRDLREVWDRLPDRDTKDEFTYWGFSERAMRFTEAEVFALLGDSREAMRAADQAYALYSPALVHGRANLRLIQSYSLVRERDVSDGLDHALTSVQGLPVTPYRRLIVGRVVEALPERARTLPAARELRALVAAS
ncbi:helix-turn-helix transcriptional regulator [Streptosporangium sp. NPDC051022]|uniref:helix-turn-helix transcriptional regulator n=1 Tax=Streptosporangium sp. NPDC051022 TaxID=3155752 RepID=UPI00342A5D73